NYTEPTLRKALRGRLGEAVAHNLDRTVVERVSDRLADEIHRRIPVLASVREFMLEFGRVLDEERVLRVRAGIFRPAFGAPRDDIGRTKLAERLISGSDFEYAMAYPGRTLALEAEYLFHLHLPQENVFRL